MNEKKIYRDMFNVFAQLHPHEAYELNPEMFLAFMKEQGYNLSKDEIEDLLIQTNKQ